MVIARLSEQEFLRIAEINVAALNQATADLPSDRLRMHLCWGNWHGPHHRDISVEKIFNVGLVIHNDITIS